MTLSSTAPAHPHATKVAMYPALFRVNKTSNLIRKKKTGYLTTEVACGWTGVVIKKG